MAHWTTTLDRFTADVDSIAAASPEAEDREFDRIAARYADQLATDSHVSEIVTAATSYGWVVEVVPGFSTVDIECSRPGERVTVTLDHDVCGPYAIFREELPGSVDEFSHTSRGPVPFANLDLAR